MSNVIAESTCADRLETIQKEIGHLNNRLDRKSGSQVSGIDTSAIGRMAVDFFVATMQAICDEVQAKRLIQARILTRPQLELSVSVLWATIIEDGWPKLVTEYCDNVQKEMTFGAQALDVTLPVDGRNAWDDAKASVPKVVGKLPRIDERCRIAWEHMVGTCNNRTTSSQRTNPLYDVTYRSLCGPGHANLLSIGWHENCGREEQIRNLIVLDCAFAGQCLYVAIGRILGEEERSNAIESVIERMGNSSSKG